MGRNLLMVFGKHYQMMRSAWHFGCQLDFHHSFDSRILEQKTEASWALTYLSSWVSFTSQQVPMIVWLLGCSPTFWSFKWILGNLLYLPKQFKPGQSQPLVPFNKPWTFSTCWSIKDSVNLYYLLNLPMNPDHVQPFVFVKSVLSIPILLCLFVPSKTLPTLSINPEHLQPSGPSQSLLYISGRTSSLRMPRGWQQGMVANPGWMRSMGTTATLSLFCKFVEMGILRRGLQ